ncbi:MAG: putative phage tail protein [Fusobacterium sp.]|uniref:putative phage tail protein n=1 Tax=Fusobacterium sp. TaxID=68766 RepID=UPI00399B9F63
MLLDNPKKVDLLKYLPFFIQNYKEIDAIMKAENIILQNEWEYLKQAFKNNFIFLTDAYGISLFEKMMKIYPKGSDTLEERQVKVYTKWNTTLPYTWRWLEEYLKAYFLNTSTEAIPILFNDEYRLDIRLSSKEWFGEYEYKLFDELRILIPANLILNIVNVLPKLGGTFFCKSFLVYRIKKNLKNKAQSFITVGNMYAKSSMIYKIKKEMSINGI